MMDVLVTILVAVPLTAFITLLTAACGVANRENEAYMEGFNAGHMEGYRKGIGESKEEGADNGMQLL